MATWHEILAPIWLFGLTRADSHQMDGGGDRHAGLAAEVLSGCRRLAPDTTGQLANDCG